MHSFQGYSDIYILQSSYSYSNSYLHLLIITWLLSTGLHAQPSPRVQVENKGMDGRTAQNY